MATPAFVAGAEGLIVADAGAGPDGAIVLAGGAATLTGGWMLTRDHVRDLETTSSPWKAHSA
ncbi:hypothetical protein AB0E77_11375 [Streptomyces sp. NPDC032940]|uniref:hypothetical protein n=1 Tax=Streptomyces sp. NPDC032940 TaxID=3155366 RepID=UPI0033D4D271